MLTDKKLENQMAKEFTNDLIAAMSRVDAAPVDPEPTYAPLAKSAPNREKQPPSLDEVEAMVSGILPTSSTNSLTVEMEKQLDLYTDAKTHLLEIQETIAKKLADLETSIEAVESAMEVLFKKPKPTLAKPTPAKARKKPIVKKSSKI